MSGIARAEGRLGGCNLAGFQSTISGFRRNDRGGRRWTEREREREAAKKKRIVRRQRERCFDAFDVNGDSTLGHSLAIDLNADNRALS